MKYPPLTQLHGVFGVIKPRGMTAAKTCKRIRNDLVRGICAYFVNKIDFCWHFLWLAMFYQYCLSLTHIFCCCSTNNNCRLITQIFVNIKHRATFRMCQNISQLSIL